MLLSLCHLILLLLLHFCILKIYSLGCVHFSSFHAVTLLGQGLSVTKAAEVAMAPIAKAFPMFSGALIVADVLGNFGKFSVLINFFHFGISQSFDRRPWTGRFSFKTECVCVCVCGGGGWGGGRKSMQLNNLESVSTILMFTSVQKMNDLVVQLKVQKLVKGQNVSANDTCRYIFLLNYFDFVFVFKTVLLFYFLGGGGGEGLVGGGGG